jgi:hypothetical protein
MGYNRLRCLSLLVIARHNTPHIEVMGYNRFVTNVTGIEPGFDYWSPGGIDKPPLASWQASKKRHGPAEHII